MKVIKESLTKIGFSELNRIKNINSNREYNVNQFAKHRDNKDAELLAYEEDGDIKALAAICKNHIGLNELFILTIQSFEKGYGAVLLDELKNKYKNVILLCDPNSNDDLKTYYKNQKFTEVELPETVWNKPASLFYFGNFDYGDVYNAGIKFYNVK